MECLIPQAEEALEYLLHDGASFAVENRTGAADVRAAGCVVCVVAWDASVKKSTVVVVVVVLPVFLPATPEPDHAVPRIGERSESSSSCLCLMYYL